MRGSSGFLKPNKQPVHTRPCVCACKLMNVPSVAIIVQNQSCPSCYFLICAIRPISLWACLYLMLSFVSRASDVDLFIYGLDEKAATAKVRQLFEAVKLANPKVSSARDETPPGISWSRHFLRARALGAESRCTWNTSRFDTSRTMFSFTVY